MEYGISKTPAFAGIPRNTRFALIAWGLWLRVGIVGALGVLAGVLQFFESEVKPLAALALVVGGAALAAIGWWRARAIVDGAGGATAERVTAPAASGARVTAGT
jgi:hypothetical protein